MEYPKAIEYKKTIGEQAEALKQYVESFEVYMAKDEAALGELCGMMDSILRKVGELNQSINEQSESLKRYLLEFETIAARDESAFAEVNAMMDSVAKRVDEIDEAHQKRIVLLGELNRTYKELETSRVKFAENIRGKADSM
jgi:molybdopterin converting factor small subunit